MTPRPDVLAGRSRDIARDSPSPPIRTKLREADVYIGTDVIIPQSLPSLSDEKKVMKRETVVLPHLTGRSFREL